MLYVNCWLWLVYMQHLLYKYVTAQVEHQQNQLTYWPPLHHVHCQYITKALLMWCETSGWQWRALWKWESVILQLKKSSRVFLASTGTITPTTLLKSKIDMAVDKIQSHMSNSLLRAVPMTWFKVWPSGLMVNWMTLCFSMSYERMIYQTVFIQLYDVTNLVWADMTSLPKFLVILAFPLYLQIVYTSLSEILSNFISSSPITSQLYSQDMQQ